MPKSRKYIRSESERQAPNIHSDVTGKRLKGTPLGKKKSRTPIAAEGVFRSPGRGIPPQVHQAQEGETAATTGKENEQLKRLP